MGERIRVYVVLDSDSITADAAWARVRVASCGHNAGQHFFRLIDVLVDHPTDVMRKLQEASHGEGGFKKISRGQNRIEMGQRLEPKPIDDPARTVVTITAVAKAKPEARLFLERMRR